MKKNQEIIKELQEIAPQLSKIETGKNLYEIPENYFQTFEKNILSTIAPEPVFHALSVLKKENLYAVPENYFEEFAFKIKNDVSKAEFEKELQHIAPSLCEIPKQPMYTVDVAYFDSFEKNIYAATIHKKSAAPAAAQSQWLRQLVGFFDSLARPSVQFSFAGVVAVLMIVSVFFMAKENYTSSENMMLSLSKNEIASYIAMNQDEFDENLLNGSALSPELILDQSPATQKEIEKYILEETTLSDLEEEVI